LRDTCLPIMKTGKQGFTSLELLVSMAIVAILLGAGVPSLRNYSWNLRMKTTVDTLQTDLNLARRSAISLNTQTIACPAPDGGTCSGDSIWTNGWIVFTDLNADNQRQVGEPLLKQAGAVEFINISSSRSRRYLRFNPDGFAPGSNMAIRFCDKRGARYASKISISSSGRIRQRSGGIKATRNCP